MEINAAHKFASHVIRLLKVSYIDLPIGRTNKGNLALKFDDSGDFTMMLDSVPLSTKNSLEDENNIELKRMLEKYWFDEIKGLANQMIKTIIRDNPLLETGIQSDIKKRGRPAGSKNHVKTTHKETA